MPLAAALPYIAMAASAAGTVMSMAGNAKSQSAMESARAAATAKQKALQERSDAVFQQALKKNTAQGADQEMAAGATGRTSIWNDLQKASNPIASALPATDTSTATGKSAKRTSAVAQTWNQLNSGNEAKANAYGDWRTSRSVDNADTAGKLGVVNNFSQGDAALLPIQLDVASHAGDGLTGWGQIVGTLGTIAGAAGSAFRPSAGPLTSGQQTWATQGAPGAVPGGPMSGMAGQNAWMNVYQ